MKFLNFDFLEQEIHDQHEKKFFISLGGCIFTTVTSFMLKSRKNIISVLTAIIIVVVIIIPALPGGGNCI